MNRPEDNGDNIENPDELSPEDLKAMGKERRRRAAWKHPSGRHQTPPIELRYPRLEHVPGQRSGE